MACTRQNARKSTGGKPPPVHQATVQTSHRRFVELQAELTNVMSEIESGAEQQDILQTHLTKVQARLLTTQARLQTFSAQREDVQRKLDLLKPHQFFDPELAPDLHARIINQLGAARNLASLVSTVWRGSVKQAVRHSVRRTVLCAAVGGESDGGDSGWHDGHTIICTSDGVWSFGNTSTPALGYPVYEHDSEEDEEKDLTDTAPRSLPEFADARAVAAATGKTFTVVCTDKGEVFQFGYFTSAEVPRSLQKFGPGKPDNPEIRNDHVPRLISGLSAHKVVALSTGSDHAVLRTDAGAAITFGFNSCGQLGFGSESIGTPRYQEAHKYQEPRLVDALVGQGIIHVGAGRCRTVVCTETAVYTFGQAQGFAAPLAPPGMIPNAWLPRQVEFADGKISGVACGLEHFLLYTETGKLFSWGSNRFGQLGHGADEIVYGHPACTDVASPQRVLLSLTDEIIAGVGAGSHHSLVYTQDGELFTFGFGCWNQLGYHGISDYDQGALNPVPRLVASLTGQRVVGVASGSQGCNHSIAWTDQNVIFTFGFGSGGGLHGQETPQEIPDKLFLRDCWLKERYNQKIEFRQREGLLEEMLSLE